MTETVDGVKIFNPNCIHVPDNIVSCAKRRLEMVAPGCESDSAGAVICGIGPSILETTTLDRIIELQRAGYIVFAIKGAISLCRGYSIPVKYSVSMDPSVKQVRKTPVVPGVTYLVASSCAPNLFDLLIDAGCDVLVYHNSQGTFGEDYLYHEGFERAEKMTGGLTVANRALTLARYMGCKRIVMAGCDFGWRDDSWGGYADGVDGRSSAQDVRIRDRGETDGREWFTRPDLLVSAIEVAREIQAGGCEVIGDSLAGALAEKPEEYLLDIFKISGGEGHG